MLDGLTALVPGLAALYEDLHAHPELSFAEHRTAGILAGRLEALGFEVAHGVGRTGVVATLANGAGPTVLLRADIDALPVREATGLPYASTATAIDDAGAEVPVMHACGHDMHATWLVGTAALLAAHRDRWSGTALLVLQPAEEIGAGAAAMVDDGLFERFGRPDVALAQHLAAGPAGIVAHRSGPVMAASDSIWIVLHGRGAHASTPEHAVDPILMAASFVTRVQAIVAREIPAGDPVVVTVGTLHAGTKENVIPDRAELGLSVRTYSPATRERVLGSIERIARAEAAAAGAPREPEITPLLATPVVDNDPAATVRVVTALRDRLGAERLMPCPIVSASEDFAIFGARAGCPSVYWFVGGTDPAAYAAAAAAGRIAEEIPMNHAPGFAPVQDPTIRTGVEALTTAALAWLGRT